MKRVLAAAFLSLVLLPAASAGDAGMATVGDLMIHDGWARASIGKAPNSAAYMTLMTHGATADRLVAVETPAAARAELHHHVLEDGIARMRQIEAIEIAPGEPATLEPGGLHIMLMGLTGKLEEGAFLPLTLTFENAGHVTLEVPIKGLKGGRQSSHGHNHGS
jgi:copper(I)-binding protein